MPTRSGTLNEPDLFAERSDSGIVTIAPDAFLLPRFVATAPLVAEIERIAAAAPFRQLRTPGGGTMSVAMTNCGALGWHSDASGYRYVATDPLTGLPWSKLPPAFAELAGSAARTVGFGLYEPDCCLINRYTVGTHLGTHRDNDERDLGQPIVSVSIGLSAVFLWYGATRKGPPQRVRVTDGDVVVWGRTARAGFHGVRRLTAGEPGATASIRYNLTFRRAH